MKVTFERTVGPEYMIPVMNTTEGKTKAKKRFPKPETYLKMLLSEHSPSRVVRYFITVQDIPYYAHVHLIRHNIGVQFYVRSQRDDGGYQEITSRDEIPQGSLVNLAMDANAQSLINIAKFRDCYKAHRVVQSFVSKLKLELMSSEKSDEYDRILAKALMKRCQWNGGYCQEPQPCGRVLGVRTVQDVHGNLFKELK